MIRQTANRVAGLFEQNRAAPRVFRVDWNGRHDDRADLGTLSVPYGGFAAVQYSAQSRIGDIAQLILLTLVFRIITTKYITEKPLHDRGTVGLIGGRGRRKRTGIGDYPTIGIDDAQPVISARKRPQFQIQFGALEDQRIRCGRTTPCRSSQFGRLAVVERVYDADAERFSNQTDR